MRLYGFLTMSALMLVVPVPTLLSAGEWVPDYANTVVDGGGGPIVGAQPGLDGTSNAAGTGFAMFSHVGVGVWPTSNTVQLSASANGWGIEFRSFVRIPNGDNDDSFSHGITDVTGTAVARTNAIGAPPAGAASVHVQASISDIVASGGTTTTDSRRAGAGWGALFIPADNDPGAPDVGQNNNPPTPPHDTFQFRLISGNSWGSGASVNSGAYASGIGPGNNAKGEGETDGELSVTAFDFPIPLAED